MRANIRRRTTSSNLIWIDSGSRLIILRITTFLVGDVEKLNKDIAALQGGLPSKFRVSEIRSTSNDDTLHRDEKLVCVFHSVEAQARR